MAVVTLPSPLKNVGASLTAVTVSEAVSLAVLKALVPPVAVMTAYWPSMPLVWSQARKVMASLTVPANSPKGISRSWAVGPRSRANSFVWLPISSALIVSHEVPPSRLYCQVPRLVLRPVMAIASTAAPSGSVMLPSTTSEATVTPLGLVAPSRTLPSIGLAVESRTGASFTLVTWTFIILSNIAPTASVTRTVIAWLDAASKLSKLAFATVMLPVLLSIAKSPPALSMSE